MKDLQDDGCPQIIRDYVRQLQGIDVYEHKNRGNLSEVYFGRRVKFDDDVALKFSFSRSKDFDESEEAVILKRINHPNILTVDHVEFVPPNWTYFLCPKISGGDLRDLIDKKAVSLKEALKLTAGILEGIVELHSQHSLVHRDLKPSNILYDRHIATPIIADLGSVKKIEEAEGYTTSSETTLLFLPPEAIAQNRYFFKSDIYQVGLILYGLLYGHFPVYDYTMLLNKKESAQVNRLSGEERKNAKAQEFIIDKIRRGKLADIDKMPQYIPAAVKKLLRKVLHKDLSKRLDAANFLREIHKLIRYLPDYKKNQDHLIVIHNDGKQFRINPEEGSYAIEKNPNGKKWTKINQGHNGSYESALTIANRG